MLAFAASCPESMAAGLRETITSLGEYGQNLLGVVPCGENNWLPMEPVDRDNLFTEFPEWTKACRSAFTHVGLLQSRLQRLRENWPTLFDRECTAMSPEARHFVVREVRPALLFMREEIERERIGGREGETERDRNRDHADFC